MIKEDYVSFETAKLLKEKGFTIPYDSFRGIYVNGKFKRLNPGSGYLYNSKDEIIEVCSLQLAMKWLREVHNIFIGISVCERYENQIDVETKVMFFFELLRLKEKQIIDGYSQEYVSTYEEACEAAIKYCLKNLI